MEEAAHERANGEPDELEYVSAISIVAGVVVVQRLKFALRAAVGDRNQVALKLCNNSFWIAGGAAHLPKVTLPALARNMVE